jgi:hypothetical protein
MKRWCALVVACGLLTAPYIDWQLTAAVPLPGGAVWNLNVPVADAMALLALVTSLLPSLPSVLRRRPDALQVLEGAAWLGLWGIGAFAAHHGDGLPGAGPDGLHTLVRKPIFLCLAWRVGFAECVRRGAIGGRTRSTLQGLSVAALLCAALLFGSSVARIGSGEAFWWRAIEGLTNNHKTLAVFLAPLLPLVSLVSWPAAAAIGVALVLSWSKAAWVTALYGLGWVVLPRRVRAWSLGAGAAIGLLAMAALPYLARSVEQIDSLRSRMSLNKRAIAMFWDHPWVGYGAGSNVRYELSTFPDYRVNGVDAHGVFAKLISEFGGLGLCAWLVANGAIALRFSRATCGGARASRLDDAIWGCFLALNLNLLTSTETFSQTHWAILGLLTGLSARRR